MKADPCRKLIFPTLKKLTLVFLRAAQHGEAGRKSAEWLQLAQTLSIVCAGFSMAEAALQIAEQW